MGKLSEAAIVNSINSEYVLLTDSNGLPVRISKNNLAEAVRNVMSEATTEKNGLKPANEVRMEKRLSASNSLIIFEPEISTNPKPIKHLNIRSGIWWRCYESLSNVH